MFVKHSEDAKFIISDKDKFVSSYPNDIIETVPGFIKRLKYAEDYCVEFVSDPFFKNGSDGWTPYGSTEFGINYEFGGVNHFIKSGCTLFLKPALPSHISGLIYHHPVHGSNIPVNAGDNLSISGLYASHGGDTLIYIEFSDRSGFAVETTRFSLARGGKGGPDASGYLPFSFLHEAPSGSATFRVKIEKAPVENKKSLLLLPHLSVKTQFAPLVRGQIAEPLSFDWPSDWAVGLFEFTEKGVPSEDAIPATVPRVSIGWRRSDLDHFALSSISPTGYITEMRRQRVVASDGTRTTSKILQFMSMSNDQGDDLAFPYSFSSSKARNIVEILCRASKKSSVEISIKDKQSGYPINEFTLPVAKDWETHKLIIPDTENGIELSFSVKNRKSLTFDVAQIALRQSDVPSPWSNADLSCMNRPRAPAHQKHNTQYEDGVCVVTPTGDRPEGLRLLMAWMKAQTRQPDQWIIVDDGMVPFPDVADLPPYAEYHRRERTKQDFPHTLANQLAFAVKRIRYDKMMIMEDDDWYRSDYIEFMSHALKSNEMVGLNKIHYYHYYSRLWKQGKPQATTSLAQTALRHEAYHFLAEVCTSDIPGVQRSGLVDRFLWRGYPGSKLLVREHETMNVGLKGTPGRAGIAEGHKATDAKYQADYDFTKLSQMLGNDIFLISKGYGRVHNLVIYTALAGGVDALYDPEHVIDGAKYICFTDNENIKSSVWEIRPFPLSQDEDSNRMAKHPKILPHLYFPDFEWSLWVDANIRIKGSLEPLIAEHISKGDSFVFKHPDRTCLYNEAEACIRQGKDLPDVINEQMTRYASEGFPEKLGMGECNVLLRRHNAAPVQQTMETWWNEIKSGSKRDQLSHAYSIWKNEMEIAYFFDGEQILKKFPTLQRTGHLMEKGKPNSRIVFSSESIPIAKRLLTKGENGRLSCSQFVHSDFNRIDKISLKVGTHKGAATGDTMLSIYGIDKEPDNLIFIGSRMLPLGPRSDNNYVSADFDGVDVSKFSEILIDIESVKTGNLAPVSLYHLIVDEMSFSPSPIVINGNTEPGMLAMAISGD
jgi:hypothetical protein